MPWIQLRQQINGSKTWDLQARQTHISHIQRRVSASYLSESQTPLDFLVNSKVPAGLCDSYSFLNFLLKVAPELRGGGKRGGGTGGRSSSPSLRAKISFLVCRMVGQTVQGLMRKVGLKGAEGAYNGMFSVQYTWPAWGAALRTQRNRFCNFFFFLAGQIPTEWLMLWMSQWMSAFTPATVVLLACTQEQVEAATALAQFAVWCNPDCSSALLLRLKLSSFERFIHETVGEPQGHNKLNIGGRDLKGTIDMTEGEVL